MRTARLVFAFLLLASGFMARPLAAQSVYGLIWGRLTAPAGTPVSMAQVTVTSVQTGARAQTKTDAGGYFTISNLTPDLYQIEVQADGFRRVQSTVSVSVDATTTVDATLQAGDPNVTATPTSASGSVLKLDRTDVSTQFDLLNVDDLPLLNRNVTELQLLVPGASIGRLFIPPNQNPQNGESVNINGQHFSGTAFQLDGTENVDPLEGIVVINPTLDSVAEMKVTTQGYNAEFGEATAGVVTVQTKSGSNSWHGDGFGFRRTGFGQSENPFDAAGVPPSKYNIFGGSLGGPIAKNKLFLFGDYQGTRSSQGGNLLLSVPPPVVHTTCLGPGGASGSMCDLSDYSKFILPETGSPLTTAGYLPNSIIPSQSVALLGLIPLPNHTSTTADPNCSDPVICDNFLAAGQEVYSADEFDVRTNYNASSRMRVFGRYSFGEFYDSGAAAFGQVAGGAGTNPSQFAGVARTRNQGISSGFTYTVGPKLLTDVRFGYFRYRLNVDAEDNGQTPAIGVPNIFAADTGDPFATGTPDFEIPGAANKLSSAGTNDYLRIGYSLAANSCACPLREREQQFQFVNNWTRSTGKHIVKWGADLRFLQNFRLDSDRPPTGYFDFSPSTTGLGLATFLTGEVTAGFDRTISGPSVINASEDQKRFNFYGQDNWRVNSRFTLNYGLRWEIYFPQTATGAGGFLIPNFANRDPGANFFTGPPAGGVEKSLTNFAPRLGFAYLVNPSTVVRAGYGRSFDAGYAGNLFGIAATDNPPVTVDQNVQGVFNLAQGPPVFQFPAGANVSLLDLAAANLQNVNATPRIPASGAVLYAVPSRIRVPTVDSWNLTVQHELTSQLYFELAYVGNKGTNVFTDNNSGGTSYNLNQPSLQNLIQPVVGGNTDNCKVNAIFGSGTSEYCLTIPEIRSFYQNVQIPNTSCSKAKPGVLCTFNPTLFQVNYFGNNASDNYNSLQAKVRKRFSRGYSFLAHYTWSKGFDYGQNYFASDPRAGYGPDSFSVKHRFVMTNIWDLPIGRNQAWLGGIGPMADRFVGGWTISAITTWRSGIPFTPTYLQSSCNNDTDDLSGVVCIPNRVGFVAASGSRTQYFTTTGGINLPGFNCDKAGYCGVNSSGQPMPGPAIGPWQRPGAGQIGNAGRDSLTGPGFFQSDIALAKAIHISEGTSLRFRVDAFNAFNRVNLGQPNTCVDCSGGGEISSLAYDATQRLLQFSLTVVF
jgi:carboxypeptidase family protein/TonB-dependent receptor-like protein